MTDRRNQRRTPALRVRCSLCQAETAHRCPSCSTEEVPVPVCGKCRKAHAALHGLADEDRRRLLWVLREEFDETRKRSPQGALWDAPAGTKPFFDDATMAKLKEAPPLTEEQVKDILKNTEERLKKDPVYQSFKRGARRSCRRGLCDCFWCRPRC